MCSIYLRRQHLSLLDISTCSIARETKVPPVTVFHFHAAEVPSSSLTGVTNASGLPSLWPQALAEALKVNKTVTSIDLEQNSSNIGREGAEAWCPARGASGQRTEGELQESIFGGRGALSNSRRLGDSMTR
eukprot:symbB.v1.2.005052.t1/scaffold291.1/size238869/17